MSGLFPIGTWGASWDDYQALIGSSYVTITSLFTYESLRVALWDKEQQNLKTYWRLRQWRTWTLGCIDLAESLIWWISMQRPGHGGAEAAETMMWEFNLSHILRHMLRPRTTGRTPCRFHASGRCRYGSSCRFSHARRLFATDNDSDSDRYASEPPIVAISPIPCPHVTSILLISNQHWTSEALLLIRINTS